MGRSAQSPRARRALFVRGGALVLIAISLTVAAHGAIVIASQVGKTWTGFPIFQNGAVGPIVVAAPRIGQAFDELIPQQRVVAVDGVAVSGGVEIQSIIERRSADAPVRYTLEDASGRRRVIQTSVLLFTERDIFRLYLPLAFAGALFLFVLSAPALLRPELPMAVPILLTGFGGVTQFSFNWPDVVFSYHFVPFQLVFQFLLTGGLVHLAMVFPEPRRPFTTHPRSTLAGIYGSLGAFWCFFGYAFSSTPSRIFSVEHLSPGVMLAGLSLLLVNAVRSAVGSDDPKTRRLAKYVVSMLAGFLVAAVLLTLDTWRFIAPVVPASVYSLPSLLLVVVMIYAVLTHNIFEFDAFVRRGLSRAVLTVSVLTFCLGVLALLPIGSADLGKGENAAILAVVFLVVVPAVPYLSRLSDGLIERLLFSRYRAVHRAIHDVTRKLTYLHEPNRVVALLRSALVDAMACESLQVVSGGRGESLQEITGRNTSDALVLDPGDELAMAMAEGYSLSPDLNTGRTRTRRAALNRAASLGVSIVIPFPVGSRLLGGLLLGERTDGRMYTRDDQMLMEMLAAQVAVSLENALAWNEVNQLTARLERENHSLRQELGGDGDAGEMVGSSPAIRAVIAQLERVAKSDASVLVTGETGTGKELAVRALHRMSDRSDEPLVKVACAAIPETLLESELFGYEKGAFTGADQRKLGRLELANRGTVFFDEVDTLPVAVQAKLLRTIQEGEVQRLGSNQPQRVDLRVVCATNRDLEEEVREGRFRQDLFYRLNVIPVELPPLRERRTDIPLLVQAFVELEAPAMGREVHEVSAATLDSLMAHDWPGNVRELRNAVQRALVMGEPGPVLKLAGPLGANGGASPAALGDSESLGAASLADLMRRYKARLIREALEVSGGNQRLAAARLGMHRPSLTRMIRDLQIQIPEKDEA